MIESDQQISDYIIDHVESAVKLYPNNIAIIAADYENGKTITYDEMWKKIVILSELIRSHFNPNDASPLVSVMMNRGFGAIISILSVLKAGAAYVPVDPSFPTDRQEYIFTHSKSQLLLVDEDNIQSVKSMGQGQLPPVIIIDAKSGYINHHDPIKSQDTTASISRPIDGETAPVYVLYTSGSTGK